MYSLLLNYRLSRRIYQLMSQPLVIRVVQGCYTNQEKLTVYPESKPTAK
jgi:hypothetical protein